MPRTDDEVARILQDIYVEEFGGRSAHRFVLTWGDLRAIYGYRKLRDSRFDRLSEAASYKGIYVIDLGEGENGHLALIIRIGTVDRWRRVPKRIIEQYRMPLEDGTDEADDD